MSMFNRKSEPTAPASQPVSPPVVSEQPNRTLTPARPSGLLSKGVSIKGSVKFLNELLIDGEVEGTINSPGKLSIGEHAQISGEIRAKSVKVRGTVEVIFSQLNAANSKRAAPCAVTSKRRDSWLLRMRHFSAVRKSR